MSFKQLPLAHVAEVGGDAAGIMAREVGGLAFVNLRGKPGDEVFGSMVLETTGVDLPILSGTNKSVLETTLHWLGPTEWLVQLPEESLPKLIEGLLAQGIAATDVTSGYTIIGLGGKSMSELLKKACHYDFVGFGTGQSVQTNFAMTSGLIWLEAPGNLRLMVRRSFADYVQRWIADASAEYGYQFQRD